MNVEKSESKGNVKHSPSSISWQEMSLRVSLTQILAIYRTPLMMDCQTEASCPEERLRE